MNVTREFLLAHGISEDVLDAAIAESIARSQPLVIPSEPTRSASVAAADAPAKPRRPAHVTGVMNWTETQFANLLAEGRWIEPVKSWTFEDEVLQLSPDLRYLPDFRLELVAGGLSFIDCKNKHVWEDSVVKSKAAAIARPDDKFYLAQLRGGQWWVRRVGVRPRRTIKIPAKNP